MENTKVKTFRVDFRFVQREGYAILAESKEMAIERARELRSRLIKPDFTYAESGEFDSCKIWDFETLEFKDE